VIFSPFFRCCFSLDLSSTFFISCSFWEEKGVSFPTPEATLILLSDPRQLLGYFPAGPCSCRLVPEVFALVASSGPRDSSIPSHAALPETFFLEGWCPLYFSPFFDWRTQKRVLCGPTSPGGSPYPRRPPVGFPRATMFGIVLLGWCRFPRAALPCVFSASHTRLFRLGDGMKLKIFLPMTILHPPIECSRK